MNSLRYYIDLLNEAAYDNKIMALKKLYPDQAQIIDWAKRLKKPDRVMWYLNILDRYLKLSDGDINKPIPNKNELIGNQNNTFADFQNSIEHYLGQENIPKIQSFVFTNQPANNVFAELSKIEREYTELQAKTKGVDPQTNDYKLLEFPDGTNWWFIDRAYCPEEGRSGGHCGNVVGKHDTAQRILSYRDRNNRVILTFILEKDKRLGEMKAKFNQKPEDRYHPQIMSLLLNPIVQGIKGEGYLADTNFSVFDLDERYLKILQAQKPKLISDQLETTPIEILKSPDWIKQNEQYKKIVLQKSPALRELLEKTAQRKCIPVWHKSRGLDYWKQMCKDYDYIAIGGIVTQEIKRSEYDVFYPLLKIAKENNCKVHGLGFTNLKGMVKYKFYSVDSTSWLSGNKFGAVYLFDGETMQKQNKQIGQRVKTNKTAIHNFTEWVKFSKYAENNL